ncbi:hypothetical protein PPL_08372 [Heterostelium album PN500]|uniref:Gamma-secretase-activating protein C-terminal domain-containing protein n=1 Tax=Heterostelium pallidum (strain ATCC 26659 / Pp 5 / PN500) TaxID=670386 RepID=D3BI04_HETP5|nr:hypothetical protein PPL_08372 [Heterostelium album PN500]EFA78904.1 hypothetical protein PPL_08372 [Heterostelium album PN500]|eukprot:XP_020431028.1 hypothetical protein PPL_08372 [Heterostelium album PN500]
MSLNQPFPMSLSNKTEQVYQNIHVVNLNGNGLCLCHQEESNNTLIRISIYLLHLKQRIRYSIPLHSIDGGFLSIQITRVLFDCIGNLLMIYIPGNFLQFIDCSSDHDPCFGLTLHYDLSSPIKEASSHDSSDILSTRTRPLPNKISTSIIPYYLTNHKDKNKPDQYLFDYQHGILYRFQFERESILKLFNKDSISKYSLEPGTEIRAMHLTNIHVNDSEIMVRILASVCNETSLISSDLLKEYLLGSTYKILRDNKLDNQYLQILPVTSIEALDSTSKPRLKDLELAAITTQIPANIAPTKKEDPNKKRLKSFQVTKPDILQRETTLATFPGFLKNFFSDFKSEDTTIRKSSGSESTLSPQKQVAPTSKIALASNISLDGYEENPLGDIQSYSANLADYFLQISQKESKEKLTEWANSYKNVQINVVNTLYAHLRKNIINNDSHETVSIRSHPKRSQLFRVMEKLYTAIEELSCPFPKDFFSHFTILGFYCLTRTVFLQKHAHSAIERMLDEEDN